uniref:TF_AP-2 domain-containing protein n=1 Tax=Caenorhabditis japonica TaxID=281687 RepID=A0A8R1E123_CAEJA
MVEKYQKGTSLLSHLLQTSENAHHNNTPSIPTGESVHNNTTPRIFFSKCNYQNMSQVDLMKLCLAVDQYLKLPNSNRDMDLEERMSRMKQMSDDIKMEIQRRAEEKNVQDVSASKPTQTLSQHCRFLQLISGKAKEMSPTQKQLLQRLVREKIKTDVQLTNKSTAGILDQSGSQSFQKIQRKNENSERKVSSLHKMLHLLPLESQTKVLQKLDDIQKTNSEKAQSTSESVRRNLAEKKMLLGMILSMQNQNEERRTEVELTKVTNESKIKRKKESVPSKDSSKLLPSDEVFELVKGRLVAGENFKKYFVTVEEIRRRIEGYEKLTSTNVANNLRRPKVKNGYELMRAQLAERGIQCKVNKRQNVYATKMIALSESEVKEFITDMSAACSDYPVSKIAGEILDHHINCDVNSVISLGYSSDDFVNVMSSLRSIFNSVLPPLTGIKSFASNDRLFNHAMETFSEATHGFGILSQRFWLNQLVEIAEAMASHPRIHDKNGERFRAVSDYEMAIVETSGGGSLELPLVFNGKLSDDEEKLDKSDEIRKKRDAINAKRKAKRAENKKKTLAEKAEATQLMRRIFEEQNL